MKRYVSYPYAHKHDGLSLAEQPHPTPPPPPAAAGCASDCDEDQEYHAADCPVVLERLRRDSLASLMDDLVLCLTCGSRGACECPAATT